MFSPSTFPCDLQKHTCKHLVSVWGLWRILTPILLVTDLHWTLPLYPFPLADVILLREKALWKDLESHSGSVSFPSSGTQMSWDVNYLLGHNKKLSVSEILIILKWWIWILKLSHRFLNPRVDSARTGSYIARTYWGNLDHHSKKSKKGILQM